jgi:hypothetical protein
MYIGMYIYVCIIHKYTGICILVREMRMRVHVVSLPAMHTCVRLRAPSSPTMRPSPPRASLGVSAGIYNQRTCHV